MHKEKKISTRYIMTGISFEKQSLCTTMFHFAMVFSHRLIFSRLSLNKKEVSGHGLHDQSSLVSTVMKKVVAYCDLTSIICDKDMWTVKLPVQICILTWTYFFKKRKHYNYSREPDWFFLASLKNPYKAPFFSWKNSSWFVLKRRISMLWHFLRWKMGMEWIF